MITPAVREHAIGLDTRALPAYCHDLSALREHVRTVRAALPERVELYYAAKANPEPRILRALADLLDGCEVSSGGELAHVRAHTPELRLAFGGPGKTPGELTDALLAEVECFHVESAHELRTLAALAAHHAPRRPVDVLLRVNLPVPPDALRGAALAMGGGASPFGMDPDELAECVRLFETFDGCGLRLRGIHAHIASGLDVDARLELAEHVVAMASRFAVRHRIAAPDINIGGGMAVDYADPSALFDWPRFGAGLARITDEHPTATLRIEPGRALTAYSGWYTTDVLDVKHSLGETFVVVRGGTHHLRTPAARGHDQPFVVLPDPLPWPHPWERPSVQDAPITLVGQLCTPRDVLARHVPVAGVGVGDRIAFAMAGAYAWNISHHDFLMHPRPTFHFL